MVQSSNVPLARMARAVLAAAIAVIGLVHLIFGGAVSRAFPAWEHGPPGRELWTRGAGAALLGLGALVLARRRAREAAAAAGAIFLLAVLALHVPRAIASATFADAAANVLKWLAVAGAAFVLAVEAAPSRPGRLLAGAAAAAPWALGAFMLAAAVLHLKFADFVAMLLPPWMPAKLFWVYLTAATLAAGGLGLVTPRVARLAGLLSAVMFALFVVLVHVPRTIADPSHGSGWSEIAEASAFAAIAVLLALRAR